MKTLFRTNRIFVLSMICSVFLLVGFWLSQAQQPKPGKEREVEVEIGAGGNAEAKVNPPAPPININRDVNINGTLTVRDNAGIGTTNPVAKLELAGLGSSDGLYFNGNTQVKITPTEDTGTDSLRIAGQQSKNAGLYIVPGGNDKFSALTLSSGPSRTTETLFEHDGRSGELLTRLQLRGPTHDRFAILNNDGTEIFQVKSSGNIGIGTTPGNILTVVQGSSTDPIADAWTTYSSRRWKTNIQPIEDALDKIQRLRGVSFDWKADGKHDIGLIAEEVGEVIPEVVAYEENGQGAKSVDYARLVALLIEGMKEQQKEIEALKRENAEFQQTKAELKNLQAKMAQFESALQKLKVVE